VIDGIKFDTRALFAYLVKALGLEEESKITNVEISITVAGAKLYSNTHHVMIRFKICDKMARDPVSGKFLFSNDKGVSDAHKILTTSILVHGVFLYWLLWLKITQKLMTSILDIYLSSEKSYVITGFMITVKGGFRLTLANPKT
jgi:hypothetical protein